jgi:glycosyltransferase involved in cell wall biosynthesis
MADQSQHICFLAPNAYPVLSGDEGIELIGGAELQQVIVAKYLAERGYQVSMICLDFGQQDQVEIDGVKVFRAYKPSEGIPILRFLWPRLTSIWDCLKRVDADIYYQRTAGMLTGVIAAFCKSHGKKSVFAVAGNPDLETNTSRIRYARDRWIYLYGLRHVDRILVQNDEQSRLCRMNFGLEAVRIPNCYPAPTRRPPATGKYVLWVSTIRKLKQPDIFLDLAQALPSLQFRMIGGPAVGEETLYEAVGRRAAKLPNVEFLGYTPYSSIDSHFEAATLFVNTSESEGFPNTFLQAWARGVTTVSFVDCGARLDGRPVGFIVNSLAEMKAWVAKLATDFDLRFAEGARCLAYLECNHLPDRVIPQYEHLFAELMRAST